MKTKLFFSTLTMAATLAVAPAVFADGVTTDTITIEYQRTGVGLYGKSFTGTSYTTSGTVEGYELDLTDAGNVYFTGGEDSSLTITSITGTSSSSETTKTSTHNAFIVEGTTVIIDGTSSIDSELGLNLCIGTMEDATLKITGGATVSTGAYLSTVGANLATGTIIIDGAGSTLATQQITLGSTVDSLFGIGESSAKEGDYWTRDIITDDEYQTVLSTITSGSYDPTSGSYGIVNVTNGGTWTVGVGNHNDWSTNKLQLANGEINITGSGSQLILGGCLAVMGENAVTNGEEYVTGVKYSETIKVTDGGKITSAEDTGAYQVTIGNIWYASNDVVEVLVSGKDDSSGQASTFDVHTTGDTAWIGSNAGWWDNGNLTTDGGTQDVKITASNGGVFKLSADQGIIVAADSYMYTFGGGQASGASYGLNVALTAQSGGSLTLESEEDEIILGSGSPAEGGYTNNVIVKADGDGSSVLLSALSITANRENADTVFVSFIATDGGKMTLSSATSGEYYINTILNKNTKITVEKGSSLITEGKVLFNEGSSISVDTSSTWKGGDVQFATSVEIAIGADASTDNANVSLGAVTIANGASITVTIDISSLENYTEASVAILTANDIIFGYTGEPDSGTTLEAGTTGSNGTLDSFVSKYITLTEGDFELESWSYTDDGTLYANIRTLPEPSMFGLFAGLMAVGLVSTRRRRRKA